MNIKLVQRTKEFIENYHHINYCEIIIHPDGTIEGFYEEVAREFIKELRGY